MKIVSVSWAIIELDDKVLVLQRSEQMKMPLKWEFPGGKIELNETLEECIHREIKEELDIEIELLGKLKESIFHYPNISIQLTPFIAKISRGEIKLKEHKQYRILEKVELLNLDWAEADIPILNEYLKL